MWDRGGVFGAKYRIGLQYQADLGLVLGKGFSVAASQTSHPNQRFTEYLPWALQMLVVSLPCQYLLVLHESSNQT